MSEFHDEEFPLDETLCKDCVYRMSKVISPLDPEDFGITESDLEEMGIDEDGELMIEQHTCLVSNTDMDYLVKECNHHVSVTEGDTFFLNNPYE